MSERKHADLWRELVDEAGEDAIDRAATVSVAEAEAELAAAGFDVAAERAKAGAFVDALGSEVSSSNSKETAPRGPEPTRRKGPRPAVVWLAAAATFAVAGGVLYALFPPPDLVGSAPPPASSHDRAVAADMRRKAAAACDAKQWSVCLAELDDARAVDPEGDDVPAVTSLRDEAIAGSSDGR
jgi:hypothetical protein